MKIITQKSKYRFCIIIAYTKTTAITYVFLTKLIQYQETMVLIIYTKNASNLTKRY